MMILFSVVFCNIAAIWGYLVAPILVPGLKGKAGRCHRPDSHHTVPSPWASSATLLAVLAAAISTVATQLMVAGDLRLPDIIFAASPGVDDRKLILWSRLGWSSPPWGASRWPWQGRRNWGSCSPTSPLTRFRALAAAPRGRHSVEAGDETGAIWGLVVGAVAHRGLLLLQTTPDGHASHCSAPCPGCHPLYWCELPDSPCVEGGAAQILRRTGGFPPGLYRRRARRCERLNMRRKRGPARE